MNKYGYKPSTLDGTEYEFNVQKNSSLPKTYSYVNYMPPIINQGERSICVPCSIAAHLDWNYNVDHGGESFGEHKIVLDDIYNARADKSSDEGMEIKEALNYLKNTGVESDKGTLKIRRYARIMSTFALKYALVMNGPCIGALKVYNDSPCFWKKRSGDSLLGGHAICIVGYDENGFIIRNSWGSSWADRGYTTIPFSEAKNFLELWTIFD
jgi:C1A family cysteine protease